MENYMHVTRNNTSQGTYSRIRIHMTVQPTKSTVFLDRTQVCAVTHNDSGHCCSDQ